MGKVRVVLIVIGVFICSFCAIEIMAFSFTKGANIILNP